MSSRSPTLSTSDRDSGPDAWEVHPLYGITHAPTADCPTCNAFVAHIRAYRSSPTNGFQHALQEYHSRYDKDFHDGVAEGRHRERVAREGEITMKLKSIEQILRSGEVSTPTTRPASSGSVHTDVVSTSEPGSRVRDDRKSSPPASYALVASSHAQPSLSSQPPRLPLVSPTATRSANTVISQLYYDTHSFHPRVEQQLNQLFHAAHTGDEQALSKVKQLCTEAHATPAEEKTFGMRFVLSRWRNPVVGPPQPSSSRIQRHTFRPPVATGGIINPRADDPPETWWQYLRIYRTSWPRGVRADENGDPNLSDVKAHRIFARLRPVNCPSTTRTEFTLAVLSIFTTPGRYAQLVSELALQIAPFPKYIPYQANGSTGMTTEEDVARHFAACGITILEAEHQIAPWAHQYMHRD